MPRILLVKTSSLGDVVHNLPVVSDVLHAMPGAEIDWVVEEGFSDIPRMHPGVRNVLPVSLRRWKKTPCSAQTRAEVGAFRQRLRQQVYDAVIDTQGLLKSAIVTRTARGTRHGLDWTSAREPLALFYDRTYAVPWTFHAVERNRILAAKALGYVQPVQPDFGIIASSAQLGWMQDGPFVVLLHATSADSKLWPEPQWLELGARLHALGMRGVLPWGSGRERERSERLSSALPGSIVPPYLSVAELGALLARARCVVGVDTGLTHLAAALGAPTVGLYFATDPAATGIYGCAAARNAGRTGTPPSVAEVMRLIGEVAT